MAFILNSTCPCVTVDYPVGPGAENRRDDVMLVQGLLLTWAWNTELGPSAAMLKGCDLNAITVDGHYGPKTKELHHRAILSGRRSDNPELRNTKFHVMPEHTQRIGKQADGKPFVHATGPDQGLLSMLRGVAMFARADGIVDAARGKYARFGLICVGWSVPPLLAASLNHFRMRPHYVAPRLIDI